MFQHHQKRKIEKKKKVRLICNKLPRRADLQPLPALKETKKD